MHKQKMKKDYAKQLTVFVLVLALVLTSVFGLMTDMPKQAFAETNSSSEISTDSGNSQDVVGETNGENPQNVDESTNGGNAQDVSGESNEGGNSSSDKVSTFADDHDHSSWTPLTTAGGELAYGKYVLDKNVNLLNNLTISDNVTLDLNGFKLTGVYGSSVITITGDGTLILLDCNGSSGEHSYTIDATGKYKFDATHNPSSATKIEGGVITGGNATSGIKGGGVNNAGTFKMSGGTIAGNTCTASKGAGGVQNSGTFEMSGGKIAGNTAMMASGVNNEGTTGKTATFDMSGTAEIFENRTDGNAGGVHNMNGTFTMSGGKIMKNKAGLLGGGVYNDLTGATFTLTGGVISENIINGIRGGGVLAEGTFNISGAPTITGNVKEVGGVKTPENVNIYKGATIKVTGALKTGDTFAKIAVTLNSGFGVGVFTSGYGEHNADTDPSKIFLMDDGKSVTLDANEVKVAPPHTHTDAIVFDKALTTAGGTLPAGNYVLNDDITLIANISIQEVTVNLCLNGHKLTGKGNAAVITTTTNATLNLYDCQENSSEHQHTYKKDATTGLYNFATGATGVEGSINGGVITGGSGRSGGGFYNGGTLNIFAGTIAGNKSTEGGSGVYNAGTFNMLNGKIVGNITTSQFGNGGGVYNFGTFSMNGGTISDNIAEIDGGGVYNDGQIEGDHFTITGGEITGNSATQGGGVFSAIDFKLKGTPTIIGNVITNTTTPSNLHLVYDTYPITVTGLLKDGETYANIGVTFGEAFKKSKPFTYRYAATNTDDPSAIFTMDNGETAVLDGAEVKSIPHTHDDGTEFDKTVPTAGGALAAGNYVLKGDTKLGSNLTINAESEVNLCLNGFKLTGKDDASVIDIRSGATLNLHDCKTNSSEAEHQHTYKKDATSGLYNFATDATGEEGTIKGGVITGGSYEFGGGITNEGTFNMFAGTIAGNATSSWGAGEGGGVYNGQIGTFSMTGGSIEGNFAKDIGGGVYNKGIFNLSGDAVISNNRVTATDGYANGAGVYNNGTLNVAGAPIIKNNKSGTAENNLYLKSGNTITVTGNLFVDGKNAEIYVTQQIPGNLAKTYYIAGTQNSETVGVVNTPIDPSRFFKYDDGSLLAKYNAEYNEVQFVNAVKVDLDANGGVLGTTTSVKAAAGVGMPTIDKDGLPTMANYIFTGFFDAKTGGTKYYDSDGTSAKVYASGIETLYAQWAFDTTIAQQIIDNVTGTLDKDITEESLKKGIEQYNDALQQTKDIVDANTTAKANIDNGIELLKVIDLLKSKPYNYGQLEKWIATWKGLTDDQKDLANIIGIPLDLTFEDMNTAYIDHRDEVDTFVKDVNAFKITIDNKDYAVELQMRFEGMPSKTDFLNNGYSRQDFVPMNVLAKIDALNKSLENVMAVEDLIDAITTPVTDEAGANQFLDANEKLNELSKSEKELVSNKNKLADGKKAYDDYVKTLADDNKKANEVIRAIGKLTYGTSPDLGSNATDILAVQKKFDDLTDAQKELVTNKTTLDDFKTTLDNVYDGSTKLSDQIKSIDISKATRAELNTIVDAYNAIKNDATNAKDGQIIRSTVGDKLTQILNLIDKLEQAETLIGDIPTGAINTKEEKIEDAKIAQEKLSENEKKLLDSGLKDKLEQEYQDLNDYLAELSQKTIIKEKADSVDVSVYGLVTKLNKEDVPGLDTATEITIYVDAKTSQGVMVDLPETLKKVASFDVKLMLKITDGDNTQVQPISGKSVLLKLPLGSKVDLATARIYHISGNGARSLVEDVTFVNENGQYFAIFKTSSFSEFIVVDEKTTEEKPSGGGSTGGGTTIPKENIFWSGINTQLKLTNTDPIVVDNSAENYSIPKYILENQKATSKTLTIKFADGEITITKEMAGKVSYTQESYTFAELKALFAESPVVTPTPTPTPTPEPTTPEVETCNLWWLWILIALVVIGGGTTYYFVNKNKKKNKEENEKK